MAPAAIVGHPGILYKIDMADYGWVIFPLPGLISGGSRFNRFDSDNFSIKPRHLWSMNVFDFESYGDGSKPCTPVVHIKIAGIYGCSFS